MNRLIYTYALIQTLYDRNQDYIDSFWPLTLSIMPESGFLDLPSIQSCVKDRYHLLIPLHILKTILGRAKAKNLVEVMGKKYQITQNGQEALFDIETEDEVERRINLLVNDLREYQKSRGLTIDIDQTKKILLDFIDNNTSDLVNILNPTEKRTSKGPNGTSPEERHLIEYLIKIKKDSEEKFKILQELVNGSIISQILYSTDASKINELASQTFKNCTIFLDSNIALYILGLDSEELNQAAQELFELLKNCGFKIKIFDFTVDEICRLLKAYTFVCEHYVSEIKVDSIYYHLKKSGWTKTKIFEFISEIESKITSLGITIDFGGGFDFENYETENKDLYAMVASKGQSKTPSIKHDVLALEQIRAIRGATVRKLEASKALFLTADSKLYWIDRNYFHHADNGTIAEAVLDKLLAAILWLKNPNIQLPIKTIIANYSRKLLVQKSVWNKFYAIISNLKKENKIDDEKIANLLYYNHIETSLNLLDESDAYKITEEFVFEHIEEATANLNKISKEAEQQKLEIARRLGDKEGELQNFVKSLGEVKKEKESLEQSYSDKILSVKQGLKEKARKNATISAATYTIIVIFCVWTFFIMGYLILYNYLQNYFQPISFLFGGSAGLGLAGILWKYLRSYLFNKFNAAYYLRLLKETNLT